MPPRLSNARRPPGGRIESEEIDLERATWDAAYRRKAIAILRRAEGLAAATSRPPGKGESTA